MNHVFLSYSREDKETAAKLYNDLVRYAVHVWFDKRSLLGGQNWLAQIKKAIKQSRFVLLLLSSHSINKRGIVQKEVREAIEEMKTLPASSVFIIPVRIEPCEPTHDALSELHWIDLFPTWSDGVSKILQTIQAETVRNERDPYTILDIADVLRAIISPVSGYGVIRDVDLQVSIPEGKLPVYGRAQQLKVALANLIHNAIRFSYSELEKAKPIVAVSVAIEGVWLVVVIRNEGCPITRKEIEQGLIFQPFYNGIYSKKVGHEGTGLGLSIARQAVNELGGTISVSSEPLDESDLGYDQPFVTLVEVRLQAAITDFVT